MFPGFKFIADKTFFDIKECCSELYAYLNESMKNFVTVCLVTEMEEYGEETHVAMPIFYEKILNKIRLDKNEFYEVETTRRLRALQLVLDKSDE